MQYVWHPCNFELVGIWASMGICYIINTLFSLYYLKSNKWQQNSNITL